MLAEWVSRTGATLLEQLAEVGRMWRLGVASGRQVFVEPWRGKPVRVKATVEQLLRVGNESVALVALIAALIGIILALQSAYQLRQLGATQLVADLVAVSVTRELAPLMTAILVAGRAGSAIAAELGTMTVSEEIDALEVIGLNPVRFLVVPRLLALLIAVPCLTLLADLVGILGGCVVGALVLDIGAGSYLADSASILVLEDLWGGVLKAVAFGGIIGLVACQQGLGTTGGADEVGRSTTATVVRSIVLIIATDMFVTRRSVSEELMPTNLAIEARGLTKSYGDAQVLRGVDLTVSKGESLVLLGGSGSGKSTLLRCLIGLEQPDEGSVVLLDQDVFAASERDLARLRRRIGMAFQSGALFGSMTVGENIDLPLKEFTGLPESTRRIIVHIKLALVGLGGTEDRHPSELSGGMKKRAAFARAMALDPEMLFFDEPSAGLDPITSAGLDQLLIQLKEVFGITLVVVTHELESAFAIADRIALIHQGRVRVTGTPEEVQACPDPIVRRFLDRVPEDDEAGEDRFRELMLAAEAEEEDNDDA